MDASQIGKRAEPPYSRAPIVPPELGWKALLPLDGAALEDQYRACLEKLGVKPGLDPARGRTASNRGLG